MDIRNPLALLGGMTPEQFMRRHWQKKPLLVRSAIPGFSPIIGRQELFELASRDDVESRLVLRNNDSWQLKRGPFTRRMIPPATRPEWTLLVQGVDLHDRGAHELLRRFRFVPDARLDDLMISHATGGGGVGPHFDSYDVFLLQAQGRRRWRIGRQKDLSLRDDMPLKVLRNFVPEEEHVLEPGDMLYLPPGYAHDGIAEGECQTYSIGFRAPSRGELAQQLLQRLSEDAVDSVGERLYSDAGHAAATESASIPGDLQAFARDAIAAAVRDEHQLDRALGEYLTEPKSSVWFESGRMPSHLAAVELDRRTRMMYDTKHVFVNGESWRASGADARLMRRLADERSLAAKDVGKASEAARSLLLSWLEAGWLHGKDELP